MNAVGWLVALLAAAGALALPYSRGLPFVLALTPFCNAYGAAVASALVLMRWAILELPRISVSRNDMQTIGVALGFLAGALMISAFVTSDLLRLASESAQWLVGVGWFCALIVGGREAHERPAILGMVAGGAALAIAHLFMRLLELHVDEFAVMPFMLSENNNYAALFALVALVILPAHPAARFSTPVYLGLAALGVMLTLLHESRAQTLIAVGVIAVVILLRYAKPRVAIAIAGAAALMALVGMFWFLRESMFSSTSIVSLANFQTNYSNLERLGLILHSIDFFSSNPFGAGLGASSDVFINSPFTIGSYPSPHNTFALMIVEIGWWGLIAYVVAVAALLRGGVRACLSGQPFGVAALAAVSLSVIDAVFFNGSVSLVFWLLLAFTARITIVEHRDRIPMVFYRTA